jgi:hypothetical protein
LKAAPVSYFLLPTASSTDERANTCPDSATNEADEQSLKQDKPDANSVVREMTDPRSQHTNECPERYRG